MKIYSPNRKYNGVTAGVVFANGVGETADKKVQKYLFARGYSKDEFQDVDVEVIEEPEDVEEEDTEESEETEDAEDIEETD